MTAGHLILQQLCISGLFLQKLVMRSSLQYSTTIHDDDLVSITHGRQSMRDDQRGSVLHQLFQCVVHSLSVAN